MKLMMLQDISISKNDPKKNSLELDFPNRIKKPVSTPYPPYADNFSEEQHQLGPFQPIIRYYLEKHQISKSK